MTKESFANNSVPNREIGWEVAGTPHLVREWHWCPSILYPP